MQFSCNQVDPVERRRRSSGDGNCRCNSIALTQPRDPVLAEVRRPENEKMAVSP